LVSMFRTRKPVDRGFPPQQNRVSAHLQAHHKICGSNSWSSTYIFASADTYPSRDVRACVSRISSWLRSRLHCSTFRRASTKSPIHGRHGGVFWYRASEIRQRMLLSGESKGLEHTVNWKMSVNLESEIMIRKAYCLCCKHTGTLECVAA